MRNSKRKRITQRRLPLARTCQVALRGLSFFERVVEETAVLLRVTGSITAQCEVGESAPCGGPARGELAHVRLDEEEPLDRVHRLGEEAVGELGFCEIVRDPERLGESSLDLPIPKEKAEGEGHGLTKSATVA